MKTKLCLSCLLLMLLYLCCDKDTVLEPELQKTPEMLPLAEGASWEYRYDYHYTWFSQYCINKYSWPDSIIVVPCEGDSAMLWEGWRGDTLGGKYTISVENIHTSGDSVIYSLLATTLADKEEEPITEAYKIVQLNDSLWYNAEGNNIVKYMMTTKYENEMNIEFGMFIPRISRPYYVWGEDGTLIGGGSKSSENNILFQIGHPKFPNTFRLIKLDSRGMAEIYAGWVKPSMSNQAFEMFHLTLESYIPGAP